MAAFDINKYRQMFLEETQDLFETIDSILLEAESYGDMDSDTINSLFRAVHTLKGNSASVELAHFAALTHEIEFFMDKLRNGELEFEESMAELLIDSIDTLKHILELELKEELEYEHFLTTKINLLDRLSSYNENTQTQIEEQNKPLDTPAFGLLLPSMEGVYGTIDTSCRTDEAIELEYDNDFFGFFDDEEEVKPTSKDDDSFGFFDDVEVDDDFFGLFDDVDTSKTTQPSKIKDDDEYFGFFDDNIAQKKPDIKLDIKSEEKSITPKENTKSKVDTSANSSIRVDLSKIDTLMNSIGELVIAHSMLSQYTYMMNDQKIKSDLGERLDLIDRYIRELQEAVMSVRMIPMETVFSKFPKIIRDTAKRLNKKIDFRHYGDNVEIDKAMIEGLTDPLTHIVRNAMDHGIESIDKRKAAGKSESGTLLMSAEQANGQIIIKIQDDGGGINIAKVTAKALQNGIIDEAQASAMSDDEKAMLIFAPGLSTAEAVTDISGRGVGMDVVMSNIKQLGGDVKVETEQGFGSTFTIILPLTLAILDGLNVRVGVEQFILPLSSIIETLKPESLMIKQIGDEGSEVLMLREEFIPVVRLHSVFNVTPQNYKLTDGLLIVVRSGAKKIALFIDEFMNQQQFVIKPLDKNFRNAHGIGGATVRGDGTIGLIIDTMNITQNTNRRAS